MTVTDSNCAQLWLKGRPARDCTSRRSSLASIDLVDSTRDVALADKIQVKVRRNREVRDCLQESDKASLIQLQQGTRTSKTWTSLNSSANQQRRSEKFVSHKPSKAHALLP